MSNEKNKILEKPTSGIAVDGWCRGNNTGGGPGGYKGIDLATRKVLFSQQHLGYVTNNCAEFIAIVHALMFMKRVDKNVNYHVVYTDSEIAMAMIRAGKYTGKLFTGDKPELAHKLWRCEMFLVEQKREPNVQKWITKEWGEIPADPGHK